MLRRRPLFALTLILLTSIGAGLIISQAIFAIFKADDLTVQKYILTVRKGLAITNYTKKQVESMIRGIKPYASSTDISSLSNGISIPRNGFNLKIKLFGQTVASQVNSNFNKVIVVWSDKSTSSSNNSRYSRALELYLDANSPPKQLHLIGILDKLISSQRLNDVAFDIFVSTNSISAYVAHSTQMSIQGTSLTHLPTYEWVLLEKYYPGYIIKGIMVWPSTSGHAGYTTDDTDLLGKTIIFVAYAQDNVAYIKGDVQDYTSLMSSSSYTISSPPDIEGILIGNSKYDTVNLVTPSSDYETFSSTINQYSHMKAVKETIYTLPSKTVMDRLTYFSAYKCRTQQSQDPTYTCPFFKNPDGTGEEPGF